MPDVLLTVDIMGSCVCVCMRACILVTDLIKVGVGLRLSHSIEVLHVDQLEVVGEARVGHLELG